MPTSSSANVDGPGAQMATTVVGRQQPPAVVQQPPREVNDIANVPNTCFDLNVSCRHRIATTVSSTGIRIIFDGWAKCCLAERAWQEKKGQQPELWSQ